MDLDPNENKRETNYICDSTKYWILLIILDLKMTNFLKRHKLEIHTDVCVNEIIYLEFVSE